MSIPESGNTLAIPAYTSQSEEAAHEIQWSQSLRTKKARYYVVKAKNQSKDNADVLLYVQDSFYKDESNPNFLGRLPGARRDGDNFIITINDRFQYGQKNAQGEQRFVVLHDKDNKMYQHRFVATTIQARGAEWFRDFATRAWGAGDLAGNVHDYAKNFVGDYLHTF